MTFVKGFASKEVRLGCRGCGTALSDFMCPEYQSCNQVTTTRVGKEKERELERLLQQRRGRRRAMAAQHFFPTSFL